MTELPEGTRILKDEKTGERLEVIQSVPGPITETIVIRPYVERLPLFTDLAGNPVHEGDEVWLYNKESNNIVPMIAVLSMNQSNSNETNLYGAIFLHRSDCEKWVNSNVKQYTLKEAYELMQKIWSEHHIDRFNQHNQVSFNRDIEIKISEQCF